LFLIGVAKGGRPCTFEPLIERLLTFSLTGVLLVSLPELEARS
jgi:hypothetical protein